MPQGMLKKMMNELYNAHATPQIQWIVSGEWDNVRMEINI